MDGLEDTERGQGRGLRSCGPLLPQGPRWGLRALSRSRQGKCPWEEGKTSLPWPGKIPSQDFAPSVSGAVSPPGIGWPPGPATVMRRRGSHCGPCPPQPTPPPCYRLWGPASHSGNAGSEPPAPPAKHIPSLGPRSATAGVQGAWCCQHRAPSSLGFLQPPGGVTGQSRCPHPPPSLTFLLLSWASSSWELRAWVWLAVAASLSWASCSLCSSSSCRSCALRSACACARSPA